MAIPSCQVNLLSRYQGEASWLLRNLFHWKGRIERDQEQPAVILSLHLYFVFVNEAAWLESRALIPMADHSKVDPLRRLEVELCGRSRRDVGQDLGPPSITNG